MTIQLHDTGKKISAKFSVLGLNLSNNGSICVLRDGVIQFYIESERITRRKRDSAIRSILKYAHNIDAIAICDSFWEKDSKKLLSALDLSLSKKMFPNAKVYDYRHQHHKCHASTAYYNSGFDEAVAIVVDANGSKTDQGIEIETVYHLPSWKVLHKKYFSQEDIGIGKKFQQTCVNYGFDEEDAGKVMGMAAYGKPDAFYLQKEWEERALYLAKFSNGKPLVLSGGCFLNCVVNYKLRKELHVPIHAEPIAHDGGTSIGAAYLAYTEHS